jgi:hypothetical protein
MNQRALSFAWGAAAALTLFGCGAASPAQDELVAQLRIGSVMCIAPSSEGKRCNTISSYTFLQDGSARAETRVTMSASVVMSAVGAATVRDNAVCQASHAMNVDSAMFAINGRPATVEETTMLREQVKANIAARAPQELCMTLAERGGRLIIDVTINAVPRPELSQPMIWIRTGDGYTVGPS